MFRSTLALLVAASVVNAQEPTPPAGQPPVTQQPVLGQGGPGAPRRPRPYAVVINERAKSERGGITVHHVDERWYMEVPDSLASRDFLLVSRIAGVPTGLGGFTSSGQSVEERVVRWQRVGDRVLLRSVEFGSVADDSLPIALSVQSNNYAPILARGDLAAAMSWSGDIAQIGNTHIHWNVPKDGGAIWTDNMLIPKGGNVYTASVYMNYVYDPKVQGFMEAGDPKRNITGIYYIPPVAGAGEWAKKYDPSVAKNPLIFPTKKMLDSVHIFDSKALNNQKYLTQWQNLISG